MSEPPSGRPGSPEPGELHAGLRPVRSEARGDLRLRHPQDASREPGVVAEAARVDGLLRLGLRRSRILGGEDPRLRLLILAALAGGRGRDPDSERDAERPHGARTLAGDTAKA